MAKRFLSIVRPELLLRAHDHESMFLVKQAHVRRVAQRLAAGHAELADDLVQDAFVQFVVMRPDLARIDNLDGYLTALVRNLHVSRLRRRANQENAHVSIEDFDSAALALEAAEADDRLITRQTLQQICEYACLRRDTSRAASVLILRFFHEFYPAQIARILRAPGRAVHDWLYEARTEARSVLTTGRRQSAPPPDRFGGLAVQCAIEVDILQSLRAAIFASSRPPCPTTHEIRSWYLKSDATPLDVATIAHVVACRPCLDTVCEATRLLPVGEEPSGDSGGEGRCSSTSRTSRRAGRNALRGFPAWQADLSVTRAFPISHTRLEVAIDIFNVLNHVNFANPPGVLTDPNFGVSTQLLGHALGGLSPIYQIGGPRSAQVSAKFKF